MTDAAVSTPPPPTTPLSEAQRLTDTFVAPSKTFADILRSAAWWGPFVIMLLVSIGFSYTVQSKVGWQQAYDNILRQNPKAEQQFANMTPAQATSAKTMAAKITAITAYVFPVISLLIVVVTALLVWATINFGFGGMAKFSTVFAVFMYSGLVISLKYVLAIVAIFAGLNGESFLLQNPVGTNIGYYLPPDSAPWVLSLTNAIDLFGIWSLVLSTIGCAIVGRVSRGKAAVAVFGWWLIFVLVGVGFAAMRG